MVPLRIRAAALVAALLAAACSFQYQEERLYDEVFLVSADRLAITGVSGDVLLQGWDDDRAKIHGTARATGPTPDAARDNLELVRLEEERGPAELTLRFDPPFDRIGVIDLELDRFSSVPRAADLLVDTGRGDIVTIGISGDQQLDTRGGDVVVSGAVGDVFVDSRKGDVEVASVAGAAVVVDTGGDAQVEGHGAIDVRADDGAFVDARGDGDDDVSVVTKGEDISFGIDPEQSYTITCHPDGGEVKVDPLLERPSENSDGSVRISHAGGGRRVTLRSNGGDIEIRAL